MVTLQSKKKGVFYGHQYFFLYFFSLNIYTLWECEYAFYFTNFAFLLICLLSLTFLAFRLNFHSFFFAVFLALAQTSLNIYKKNRTKGPFLPKRKTNTIFFFFSTEVNQTQTWSSYLYWAGQV